MNRERGESNYIIQFSPTNETFSMDQMNMSGNIRATNQFNVSRVTGVQNMNMSNFCDDPNLIEMLNQDGEAMF